MDEFYIKAKNEIETLKHVEVSLKVGMAEKDERSDIYKYLHSPLKDYTIHGLMLPSQYFDISR
jgi:hypothetical protein